MTIRTLPPPRDTSVPTRGPRRRAALRARAGVSEDTAREVLDRARETKAVLAAAEVDLLLTAWEWALLHPATDLGDDAAAWGREGPCAIAGPGAFEVAEFCIAELAAALGVSTDSGRDLVGCAVELGERLPMTWQRVLAGEVAAWRAKRLARQTTALPPVAAAWVDAHVHEVVDTISARDLEAFVGQTVARFDPDRHAAEVADRAERRRVEIAHERETPDGLSYLDGMLDSADALELDAALSDLAHQLLALHPDLTLDARRAIAMGYLARGQQVPGVPATAPSETARPRQVVLHVHLSDESIRHSGLASVEEGRLAVPVDRLAEWLGVPDARLSVRPVIDLSEPLVGDAYAAPGRLAEQVVLRDPGCVFPWCNVAARRCDLDHVDAWEVGGATASGNLAPLCRRHHRHKTHAGWTYEVISPGTYLWTSPHGLRFLRDRHATVQLA